MNAQQRECMCQWMESDPTKASKWYHKAADSGGWESMYLAGVCDLLCESTKSRPRDKSEEADLYFWELGKMLTERPQDKRAKALLRQAGIKTTLYWQKEYLYLKSFLNIAGVYLTDIDEIKE